MNKDPKNTEQYRGVHGWLLILCIWTTIVWPLFTFAKLHELADAWMYLVLGLIIFSIVSGVFLWRAHPTGVVLVRTLLIIILVLNVLGIVTAGQARPDLIPLTLIQCAVPVAWLIYLNVSKRVKATFGPPPKP